MPEPFDARTYDPFHSSGSDHRDLIGDRHAMYDARSAEIPKDRLWLVALIVASAIGLIGCHTVPSFCQQVVAWLGW